MLKTIVIIVTTAAFIIFLQSCSSNTAKPSINNQQLAQQYFNEDAGWNADNIPFFECSDEEIEQAYYCRTLCCTVFNQWTFNYWDSSKNL